MDCRQNIISETYVDFIEEAVPDVEEYIRKNLDGKCFIYPGILQNVFVYKSINEIIGSGLSIYDYDEIPKLYGLMDAVAIESTGASRLQNIPGLQLEGNGIIIGIIDDGIDAYHSAFRFSNGYTRILSAWNQEDQSLVPPDGLAYGSQITRELINEELSNPDSVILNNLADDSIHGTFTAGIAAGNINLEQGFASPAPQADIVVVKLKQAKKYLKDYYFIREGAKAYQENDIINAVVYISNIADMYNKPVIICVPLGTNQGGHSGISTLGTFLNSYAIRTGVAVVCPIGNEGNSRHHFSGSITEVDAFEDVQIRVGANISGFTIELWGRSPDIFEVEIISPTGERVKRVQAVSGQEQVFKLFLERTVIYVKYELVERMTGEELIQIRLEAPTEGVWTIRVYGELVISGTFNIWLPITEFVGDDVYFLKPDPFTTLTSPADSFIPISVGAYNHSTAGLYINSGRGYAIGTMMNPTFVAPGVNILAPTLNNSYIRLSGTSISAGITAGVMAQFMEWGIIRGNRVNMNTIEIKNYLIRGASRKPTLSYPNREWGYGTLDVYNSIDILRT